MKRFACLIFIAATCIANAGRSEAITFSEFYSELADGAFKAKLNWCDGPIEEIADSNITRDGRPFTIMMESRIDVPPEKVWAAVRHPELFSKNNYEYRKSDLLKDDGNHKEVEFHEMLLDNLQQSVISMDFDDMNHALKIETLTSTVATMNGTYRLTASPDGRVSLYRYDAKWSFRETVPIFEEVLRCGIKEYFVNQVRAIKKQIVGCDLDPSRAGCQRE